MQQSMPFDIYPLCCLALESQKVTSRTKLLLVIVILELASVQRLEMCWIHGHEVE